MENRFQPGDIVQHFKRKTLNLEELAQNKYLYRIIGVATHSETGELMMVYQPLYDGQGMFVRPLEMFLSRVDREKYPDALQKYRFEKAEDIIYFSRSHADAQHLYKYDTETGLFYYMDHCWTGKGSWYESEFPSFDIVQITERSARGISKDNLQGCE